MIRPAALLALVALVAAAPAAARHPRDPRQAFTSADRAWAHRVVLKATDLPSGWRSLGGGRPQYLHCRNFDPDLSDLVVTAKERSPDIAHGGTTTVSETTIFRTTADAARFWRRSPKSELIRCYDRIYRQDLPALRLVTGRIVAAPAVGERRLALRMAWRHTGAGTAPRYHLDTIGWLRGRAVTFFWVLNTDPVSAGFARRIVQRLDVRMRP